MLGIVIATHGKLSNGLKDSAEVIIGATNNIATVNLLQGDDVQNLGSKIKDAIKQVDEGDGIILLVDLVSASPYNQSLLVTNSLDDPIKNSVYVIGGVNLPMLLETINHQILGTPVKDIAESVVEQGEKGLAMWHASLLEEDETEDDF